MPVQQPAGRISIYDYEFWLTVFLVGLGMASPQYLPVVAASYLVWLVLRLVLKNPPVRSPVDWAIAALFVLSILSLWISPSKEKTLEQVLRLWSGIILFRVILDWSATRVRLNWLLAGLGGLAVGLGAFSFISVEWAQDKFDFLPAGLYQGLLPAVSDVVNPNVMAGTFVLFMPIGAAVFLWAFSENPKWLNAGLLVGLAFLSGVLVLSQSRGAILAFGVAGLVLLVTRWRWGWLTLLAPAAGVYYFIQQLSQDRVVNYVLGGAFGSYEGRLEIWSRGIYVIQDFPFTGVGMGLFGPVADLVYPYLLIEPGKVLHAHNLFLQVGADLGMAGLVAWLAVYFLMLFLALKMALAGKQSGDRLVVALGYGFFGSQVALGVHGLLDSVTWGIVRSAPFVWMLWAVGVVAYKVLLGKPAREVDEPI